MSEKRKSVMVLPVRGGKVLLQSFTNSDGSVTWDGFGSFYPTEEDPVFTAKAVFLEYFKKASPLQLNERALLNYLINKPGGMVDLDVTVYSINTDSSLLEPERTKWFLPDEIPYTQMHQATRKWLPLLLKNSEHIDAHIKVEQPANHTAGVVTEFTVL